MHYFVGIDPGDKGAVAVLSESMAVEFVELTPTYNLGLKTKKGNKSSRRGYDFVGMDNILRRVWRLAPKDSGNRIFLMMEKVHAMPQQGVVSMFSLGTGYGAWQALIAHFRIAMELVTPQQWQKELLSGEPGDDTKIRSLSKARRLFPGLPILREREKDHNVSDALLLAVYGLRHFGGSHD